MNDIFKKIGSLLSPLFGTRAAGIYMILFAFVIGAATFIENDYGTSAAQKVVFKTWWFELLLLLFSLTIVTNIIRFRIIQQKRWAVLTFHLAIIFIMLGSAVTRYYGYEGMMHIRENDMSNEFLSSDTYLVFEMPRENRMVQFDEPVLFASLGSNKWNESYIVGDDRIEVKVKDFIPNPIQRLSRVEDGDPIIKIVISGASGREEYFVTRGQASTLGNLRVNFKNTYEDNALNISFRNDSLLFITNRPITQMMMSTQRRDTLASFKEHVLLVRSLYTDGISNFVISDFAPSGELDVISESIKVKNESMMALLMEVNINGDTDESFVVGKKGYQGRPTIFDLGGEKLGISFGAKNIKLPFYIRLYDFIMERYPGTNSAASYASEVQLVDDRKGVKKDYRIYMNNILDHGGYRFFQSSFDKDEKGTVLSVNHDFWGTWISYFGYFLLTLGLIMTFFAPNSRFHFLTKKVKEMRKNRAFIWPGLIFLLTGFQAITAQKVIEPLSGLLAVSEHHAEVFSQIAVQDPNGRMKPMHTLTRELMRKITRKETFKGLSADQVILSMYGDRDTWLRIPMIKVGKHGLLYERLDIEGEYAAFKDFFDEEGRYIFQEEIKQTYELQPIDRGTFEKELMKVDERVNIANMIFSGRLFRVIPIPGDPNNTWMSTAPQGNENISINNFNPIASRFFVSYQPALHDAIHNDEYEKADQLLGELQEYQETSGGDVMPSNTRLRAEILLNEFNVFNRLSVVYLLLGLAFLTLLFTSVFMPQLNLSKPFRVLVTFVFIAFLCHTIGLGLRWYVSGRAPWSNGYESMIYIAWTTTLAGVLFARKFAGSMAATMVLAATILLVAQLSYLDPQITPLVPVLKSYWLTIHVSLEAGSYGFLMLGAIIGLINLILMIFINKGNQERIVRIVKEMSYISEMTLIGGLVMISVGTYLGGIWANESWGRYWGWDAKETWALVTILIYAFILHMRLMPKMKGLYTYNVATLVGWASVIMTYFGVNYYLSGLHSYAAGDPIPIPNWVYISIAVAVLISILAYFRKARINPIML